MADVLRGPVFVARRELPPQLDCRPCAVVTGSLLVTTLAVVAAPFFSNTRLASPQIRAIGANTSSQSFPLRYPSSLAPFFPGVHLPPQRPNWVFPESSSRGRVIDFVAQTMPFPGLNFPVTQRRAILSETSRNAFPTAYLSSLPPFALAPQFAPVRPNRGFADSSSSAWVLNAAVQPAPFIPTLTPSVSLNRALPETSRASYPLAFPVFQAPFLGSTPTFVARRAIVQDTSRAGRALIETPVIPPFFQTQWPNPVEYKLAYEPAQNNFASPGVIPTAITVTIKAGSWIRYRKI